MTTIGGDLADLLYGRFTESIDTPHLKEAKALLEELASQPPPLTSKDAT